MITIYKIHLIFALYEKEKKKKLRDDMVIYRPLKYAPEVAKLRKHLQE